MPLIHTLISTIACGRLIGRNVDGYGEHCFNRKRLSAHYPMSLARFCRNVQVHRIEHIRSLDCSECPPSPMANKLFFKLVLASLFLLQCFHFVASAAYCYDPFLRPEIPAPSYRSDCAFLSERLASRLPGRTCHFQKTNVGHLHATYQVPLYDIFSEKDPRAPYGCGFELDLRVPYENVDVSCLEVIQAAKDIVTTCINHPRGPRAGYANVGYQRRMLALIKGMETKPLSANTTDGSSHETL